MALESLVRRLVRLESRCRGGLPPIAVLHMPEGTSEADAWAAWRAANPHLARRLDRARPDLPVVTVILQ